MSKLMHAFLFKSRLFQNHGVSFLKPLVRYVASSSTPHLNAKNSILLDYLVGSLKFSTDKALSVSSSYSRAKSLERPREVVSFFKGLGLSDARVQSIARTVPSILFADVEKTLKPKVTLFQELGPVNSHFQEPLCVDVQPGENTEAFD